MALTGKARARICREKKKMETYNIDQFVMLTGRVNFTQKKLLASQTAVTLPLSALYQLENLDQSGNGLTKRTSMITNLVT